MNIVLVDNKDNKFSKKENKIKIHIKDINKTFYFSKEEYNKHKEFYKNAERNIKPIII